MVTAPNRTVACFTRGRLTVDGVSSEVAVPISLNKLIDLGEEVEIVERMAIFGDDVLEV